MYINLFVAIFKIFYSEIAPTLLDVAHNLQMFGGSPYCI